MVATDYYDDIVIYRTLLLDNKNWLTVSPANDFSSDIGKEGEEERRHVFSILLYDLFYTDINIDIHIHNLLTYLSQNDESYCL